MRWRIPGTETDIQFDQLLREPPFNLLQEDPDGVLVSGLVGRIWTLRRDYPNLSTPQEFIDWATPGTARVLFANWVEPRPDGTAALYSETRVDAIGRQGSLGVAAVRPLVSAFGHTIGTDAIEIAVRRAEQRLRRG